MGGKPSTNTPADMRLKRNRASVAVRAKRLAATNNTASAAATAASTAKPKFGSPAWDAKYGIKRRSKKPTPGA